ncbi:helix-turn-helix domain-containing protein [Maledivibacter halophilus]|uniref:Transcriptional regulator, contains XRE-family HTH domain n=1 Tax=Maledivibacter halophilus TaxID=36842 RepID=A0A1T5MD55_9FIRM|nr:XRE family transcriptional regulator [Maledivibacter halophilus]SKC86142.1 Transcriptional regulator, contains XRE-family HTH domain [Maledivibacter halophilus]
MLGERVREIRKKNNIKLVEMAKQINLSPSYLSQIERDLISPSLSALRKIAKVLNVPIYEFLKEDEKKAIHIKKEKRIKLELPDTDIVYEFLTPTRLRNGTPNMEIIFMKLNPFSWSSEDFSYHAADECIFVIRGEVEIYLGETKYNLLNGDSLYIKENTRHRLYNPKNTVAEVISCISPPIY